MAMVSPDDIPAPPALGYRPPASLRVVRWALIAVCGVASVSILYVAAWFFMATSLRGGIEDWFVERRAEGYMARYAKLELGGFPFRLSARLDGPALGWPDPRAPWAWEGDRMVAETRPWSPGRLTVRLAGAHRVRLTGAGGPVSYDGSAAVLTAHIVLDDGWPRRWDLSVADLGFAAEGQASFLAVGKASVEARLHMPAEPDHRTSIFDLKLKAEGLRVPDGLSLPLGATVGGLVLEGSVMGPVPLGPWVESAAAWRDDGGTIEVGRLTIVYGPLSVRANGTLALDAEMQPIGAFTAKIRGFFDLVDALQAKGLMRARDAVTAKVVLGVLSKRPESGGPPTLSLPVTIQDRKVYAGPVALTRLPPIRWPGLDASE